MPEGRVPGSSVGGQKREVMWTDDTRQRGLGARIRRNTWTGRCVDLSGRAWWFERLLECKPFVSSHSVHHSQLRCR